MNSQVVDGVCNINLFIVWQNVMDYRNISRTKCYKIKKSNKSFVYSNIINSHIIR